MEAWVWPAMASCGTLLVIESIGTIHVICMGTERCTTPLCVYAFEHKPAFGRTKDKNHLKRRFCVGLSTRFQCMRVAQLKHGLDGRRAQRENCRQEKIRAKAKPPDNLVRL